MVSLLGFWAFGWCQSFWRMRKTESHFCDFSFCMFWSLGTFTITNMNRGCFLYKFYITIQELIHQQEKLMIVCVCSYNICIAEWLEYLLPDWPGFEPYHSWFVRDMTSRSYQPRETIWACDIIRKCLIKKTWVNLIRVSEIG